MQNTRITTSIIAITLLAAAAPALADIVTKSGDVWLTAPPPSVEEGQLVSNDFVHVFKEREGDLLLNDVWVDAYKSEIMYNQWSDLEGKTIPAGTTVNSYFVHGDQTKLFGSSYAGWFQFEENETIIGVMVRGGSLYDSDSLGAPGTSYPGWGSDREWDLKQINGGDDFWISYDLRTIQFHASIWAGVDQMRVLTVQTPTPGTASLLAMGGMAAARRRRR